MEPRTCRAGGSRCSPAGRAGSATRASRVRAASRPASKPTLSTLADGIVDPDLDPVMLAEVLGAMVDQTCYIWFFLGNEFDPHAVVESLITVWPRASAWATSGPGHKAWMPPTMQ